MVLLCAYGIRTLWNTPYMRDELRELSYTSLAPRFLVSLPASSQWSGPIDLVLSLAERLR